MLHFLPGLHWFAVAGLIAAAGPVLIHLLNRRRFRVVEWAAMDFLREALRRNRRILELRDLVLLTLRTLVLALLGLALARPFVPSDSLIAWRFVLPLGVAAVVAALAAAALWDRQRARNVALTAMASMFLAAIGIGAWHYQQSRSGLTPTLPPGAGHPLHAIVILDNSLSMEYQRQQTLLDEAKDRAASFIDRLPEGSRVSVVPLCGGPAESFTLDPHPDKETAQRWLDRIVLVDRQGTASQAIQLALDACGKTPDFPPEAKRIVFLGDQQRSVWPIESLAEQLAELPELQVVDVSAAGTSNAWISSVTLQDGIADIETPATILARIRYEGEQPRQHVQVTLSVDGADVATRIVEWLAPGPGEQEIAFQHRFSYPLEPGQTRHVPIKVSLPSDQLPEDDVRYLAAPVVAALPVVFVDQYGDAEDPRRGRYGETGPFRWLLAPNTHRDDEGKQLIRIRHVTIDQLDRKLLADARLVVMAGVADPGAAVPLLRQYVEQGGRLLLAPGGDFDVERWNKTAWLDGAGILPVPLAGTVGKSLDENPRGDWFKLAYESMQHVHDDFHIAEESPQAHEEIYGSAFFYKALQPDLTPQTLENLARGDERRLAAERAALAESDRRLKEWQEAEAAGALSDGDRQARAREIERRNELRPSWLAWRPNVTAADASRPVSELVQDAAPRVLASFTNRVPYLVQRRIGHGEVLLMTSSVYSSWNTLSMPGSNAVFLLDRLVRRRLEQSLPERNVPTAGPVQIPVDSSDGRARFVLTRPDGSTRDLSYDNLGRDTFGVTIDDVSQRGIYSVAAHDSQSPAQGAPRSRWPAPIIVAANGPAEESQLIPLGRQQLEEKLARARNVRWVSVGEEISVEGASVEGQHLWWWLAAVLLGCLAVEMTIVAWPYLAKSEVVDRKSEIGDRTAAVGSERAEGVDAGLVASSVVEVARR